MILNTSCSFLQESGLNAAALASSSSSGSMNTNLDFAAILKVSQALSGTIQLHELLRQLTQIILQNSGGSHCALILPNCDDSWHVSAIATPSTIELCSHPLDDNPNLPIKLIEYVKNTQEMVVIDDLNTDLPVIDEYLSQQQPKSLLCLPLLNQGHLIGIVYLENHLTSGVFTSDRIEMLKFLCSQAAISLENARLYTEEKEKNHLLAFQSTVSHIAARNDKLSAMLQQFCQVIVDHLEAAFARIWILNSESNILELKASAGIYTHLNGDHQYVPVGKFKIGLIAQERAPHLTNDVLNDPRISNPEWARKQEMVAFAGYPLMIGDELLGVVAMFARAPLSVDRLTSLKVVATEISLGIRRKLLEASVEQKAVVLEKTLKELHISQAHLVQSEKMSSLGQLVAGVAHEINNPVNFVHANIAPAVRYASDLLNLIELYQKHYPEPHEDIENEIQAIEPDYIRDDFIKLLNSIKSGTVRIRQIVLSLRNFSRLDEAEFKQVDIHEGIDSTLMILQNRLKAQLNQPKIQVIKEYADLPLVDCYPSQLNQVFMNILVNAIDALDEYNLQRTPEEIKANPSHINISTEVTGNKWIVIRIADNAPGIPEDIKSKLFDPFFTTKEVGKGTGLGLSISYQIIVDKHSGKLHFYSTPGQGTEFVIEIPVYQSI
ncbi:GAF domain-containing sensor histidine kinase [Mastigocoleus testarum]|uniref:histidine kinase n=1 Tax=Mastigocoleus testarum BC008 TaxID=371196 RepID=A0A0V7ZP91_9CYAN|nr:GAF domain-containing protein [Mastigocoleus testarum]KST66251.1 hypothetical protein BC008_25095 [Mastigocoleus testarum BC008]